MTDTPTIVPITDEMLTRAMEEVERQGRIMSFTGLGKILAAALAIPDRLSGMVDMAAGPTQATTLTADDRKALEDQIAALEASSLGTACGCRECQELADRDMKLAARLRAKLDSIPLREVKE